MTRQEFTEGLRRALTGKLETGRVNEIVKYYEEYIMIEIRKGKSESEVLKELGDPRFIAKSILAAETKEENEIPADYEIEKESWFTKFNKLPIWLKSIIIGCVIVLVLSFLFRIVVFILPIAIPIILVFWLIRFLKNK